MVFQARILKYAEAVGWTRVCGEHAERCRGFDPDDPPAECATGRSLFFDDLLNAKVPAQRNHQLEGLQAAGTEGARRLGRPSTQPARFSTGKRDRPANCLGSQSAAGSADT